MTRRLSKIAALVLLSATALFAQGVRKDDFVINQAGKPIPNASVTVCLTSATIVNGVCTPATTVYSDAAETLPITQPILTGPIGNFGFYATPGEYIATITGSTITPSTLHYSIPCSPTATITGCASVGGNAALKPAVSDSLQYISLNGNDTSDGLSWGTAKLTVSAACAALPGGNSNCTAGAGNIVAAAGITGVFLPLGTTPAITLQWDTYTGGANGATTGGAVSSGPVPWVDIRAFGGRAWLNAPPSIVVTSPGSSPIVTTAGVADFIEGDGIAIPKAGATTAQSTPSAPSVNSIGATGSNTISYKCVGVDQYWGLTVASTAGSTTTAPTVFGSGAILLSAISRSGNVVTGTTATNMPFSSGTYHATITDVTGGTTNFSGLFLITVTSATSFTYNQTGANESGTIVSNTSYVLFENAFILTSVQATAGSPLLVLTTDVNHNIVQQQTGILDTMVYLDGIKFTGVPVQGYANGPFPVVSVTSNTITVRTPWVATATATGIADGVFFSNARGFAQMTATVWAEQEVICPVLSGTTLYYAVYANYGSGYSPIGFTTWHHNIFLDYGPAFTQTGFTPPPGMNLPNTPPSSTQNQIYVGQVKSISGSTLTLTSNVTTAVSSQTAYHDNGAPFLNAINYSCQSPINSGNNNQTFFPVYFAPTAGATYYFFNAPVNMSNTSNGCNRFRIVAGGALFLNGTWTADSDVYINRPEDAGGGNVVVSGNNTGLGVYVFGFASPLMGTSSNGTGWYVRGLTFRPESNGQSAFINAGANSRFEDISCSPESASQLSSICFVNSGTQFATYLHNVNFGGIPNISSPLTAAPGNSGQVMWWPVPAFLSEASQFSASQGNIILDGANYGAGTGFEWSNLYSTSAPSLDIEITNVQTFQEPWQPLLMFRGTGGNPFLLVKNVQMDSVMQPVLSTTVGGGGNSAASVVTFYGAGTAGVGFPTMTGNPQPRVQDINQVSTIGPSQNINDNYQSPGGWTESGPATLSCNATTGNTAAALSIKDNTATVQTTIACPGGGLTAPSVVTGNLSGNIYVDGTVHATLANALAACPSTGCTIYDNTPETFSSNPFASFTSSARVLLGFGTWITNVNITVPNTSVLEGPTFRANDSNAPTYGAIIKAGASFPASTPVLTMTGTQGNVITKIQIDCNGVSGSSGIFATDIQEKGGVRDVLTTNCPGPGVNVDASAFVTIPAQNYFIQNVECFPQTFGLNTTDCVHLKGNGGGGPGWVANITGNGASGHVINNTLSMENFQQATLQNIHGEYVANVVAMLNAGVSDVTVNEVTTANTCTDLVHIPTSVTGNSWVLSNLVKGSCTNTVNDVPDSITDTATAETMFLIGSGSVGSREIYATTSGVGKTITGGPTFLGGVLGKSSFRETQTLADQGNVCTNAELALSGGWQSTGSATVTAVAGNGQTCSWTITTGTTTAANPTVTDTLTNVLPEATTVCELNIHGGTHTAAAGEGFTQTTLSATAPVFTFIGTPTANGFTYFVTRRCGP